MKISKLFHTLYAFLMFLPVMVLPLFAININQKEVEPLTSQIEDTQLVDFNQLNNFDMLGKEAWTYSGDYQYTLTNDNLLVIGGVNNQNAYLPICSVNVVASHKYLLRTTWGNASSSGLNFYFGSSQLSLYDVNAKMFEFTEDELLYVRLFVSDMDPFQLTSYINLFDLTLMFGSGNEPTIQQFNIWYPNDNYHYINSRKQILHLGTFDTLNNTDVGSQFLYSLYNPLKDYFNLPNYMNLGGLYDWFLVNLFNGYNSPAYFIIFDLMIYWLAMSILWLIFDVLMYVPSMIHKMLDKARME